MVYKFKIQLLDASSEIWRTFQVPSTISLSEFHAVIQIVMGWTNSHLHSFTINKNKYTMIDDDFGDGDLDENDFKLSEVISGNNQIIEYIYDFGDGWDHNIKLQEINSDLEIEFPTCIDGKRNCPLEDSGGIPGYENLLEVISDKSHSDYKELTEWIPEKFDPEYFNLEEKNEDLKYYKDLLIIDDFEE